MSPRDRIAFVIAAGLIVWGLAFMIGIIIRGGSMSKSGGEIFLAIATGLVASLGVYFATKNGNNKPNGE